MNVSLMLSKRQLQRLIFELGARRGCIQSATPEIEELIRLAHSALGIFDKPEWEQRVAAAAMLGTSQMPAEMRG